MKVIVIGSGIVGASAAYHLTKKNIEVVVVDHDHKGKATAAGAGIICPWTSRDRGDSWYKLANAGAHYYPTLVEALLADGESDVSYKRVGALITSKDTNVLDNKVNTLKNAQQDAPLMGNVERMSSARARELFPPLHNELEAIFIPGAARVDGHLLREALLRVAMKYGAKKIDGEAHLNVDNNRVTGVRVGENNITGDVVLITAGAWAPKLLSPHGIKLNIEPQRGQIAHLKLPSTDTSTWPVISPEGSGHYMLAFDDSRVVIGATRETDSGFDYRVTAGGLLEVLNEGMSIAPGLSEATLADVRIGFRPTGPDYLPLLGPIDSLQGAFLANGLGPSGLTIGPYVGKLISSKIVNEHVDVDMTPYDPNRALL